MRHAEELSMTTAPAAASRGLRIFEEAAPEEQSAMSMPEKSAVSASSTVIARPRHSIVEPAERDEAKEADVVDRKISFEQYRTHHGADLAGGSHNCDSHGESLDHSASRPNARCK